MIIPCKLKIVILGTLRLNEDESGGCNFMDFLDFANISKVASNASSNPRDKDSFIV